MSNIDEQIDELKYVSNTLIGTLEDLENIHLRLDVLIQMRYEEGR